MQSSLLCRLRCRCLLVVLSFQASSATSCSDGVCPSAASLLQIMQNRKLLQPGFDGPSGAMLEALSLVPPKTLSRMILPALHSPCELLWPEDVRYTYFGSTNGTISLCGVQDVSNLWDGLHPLNMSKFRWMNSRRLLGPIGSLPCCPTPPHCMAPTCSLANPMQAGASLTCTKSPPDALYGYLTLPDAWPAYFARGGSADLDVLKHWDVLGRLFGCYNNSTGRCLNMEPFDLSIDLGSDWGSFTEGFMARKFAKDSIMVDCVPFNRDAFATRLGDASYMSKWYAQGKVVGWPVASTYPKFEFLSYALSNESGGTFDICDPSKTWGLKQADGSPYLPCPVPIETVDAIIPGKLSPAFQSKLVQAQSAYVKMDLDGMDQLAIDGMRTLLSELRGTYEDGSPRYLVNFMMLEFCPSCMIETKQQKGFAKYDMGTQVQLLKSLGFELFLIGPHYIPLSHGSWTEAYNALFSTPKKCPSTASFEKYRASACTSEPCQPDHCMDSADLFAMRASHPRSTEIKLALGSCVESSEFDVNDAQYEDQSKD